MVNCPPDTANPRRHDKFLSDLVEQGIEAIEAKERELDEKWEKAGSLPEFDGLRLGYLLCKEARQIIANQKQ